MILLKKKFLLDGTKLSLAGVCEKCKKMFCTAQKISCPLTRITSFFQNYFLLIPIMVSTSSKIVLTKKILFLLGAKSASTSWMKDIEKYVATIWKSCLYFKKFLKQSVSNGSSLKIDFPLISITVSTSRKNLTIKQCCFQ